MPLPAQIGKYEILDLIGRGGMGIVYKTRDTALGRLVALKVMTSDLAGQSEVQIRFQREARSVAALQHPNIVVVHELGEYEGSPFIAMEYLDGEPLDRLIRNHAPLTVLEKVDIILQVAKALQYAHDKGVIHRDVKPGNIMRMGDGSVKVVGFGIAHLADQTITKTGMVLGTLAYLAPEQLNGESIDRRTDIFSLGAVLYQLLSGRLPFEGGSTAEVMMKILLEAPPPLPPTGEVNPPELQPIINKALAKKKEERYQACSEISTALLQFRRRIELATQLKQLERERDAIQTELEKQSPRAATVTPVVREDAALAVSAAVATPMPKKQAASPPLQPLPPAVVDKAPATRPQPKTPFEAYEVREDNLIGPGFKRVTFVFLGLAMAVILVFILVSWPLLSHRSDQQYEPSPPSNGTPAVPRAQEENGPVPKPTTTSQVPGKKRLDSIKPAEAAQPMQDKSASAQPVRVSQGVTQGLLVHKVEPQYPLMARQARVQGVVVLRALIGKDGSIQDLHVVSGHPMLINAVLEAVKEWRYKPYYLNGEAVEVETTINVNFRLSDLSVPPSEYPK